MFEDWGRAVVLESQLDFHVYALLIILSVVEISDS